MKVEKEIRYLKTSDMSLNEESRTIEGYAIVFNSPSEDLGGFIEIIERSAVDEDTLKRSDILVKLNHNSDKILARSKKGKGNLQLTIDDNGLYYRFEAPHTVYGEECLEQVRNGVIDSSSFCFTIAKGGERWERKGNTVYRYISKIDKLYDVSPVYTPAYENTTCSKRCSDVLDYFNNTEPYLDNLIKEINEL